MRIVCLVTIDWRRSCVNVGIKFLQCTFISDDRSTQHTCYIMSGCLPIIKLQLEATNKSLSNLELNLVADAI